MFSQAIDDFLKSDNIGMQQANFSTTRYIAQLLIQKKNIQQIYKEMTDKENQCEEIITQIIDNKYSQFNPMVNKPKIYGPTKNSHQVLNKIEEDSPKQNKFQDQSPQNQNSITIRVYLIKKLYLH